MIQSLPLSLNKGASTHQFLQWRRGVEVRVEVIGRWRFKVPREIRTSMRLDGLEGIH